MAKRKPINQDLKLNVDTTEATQSIREFREKFNETMEGLHKVSAKVDNTGNTVSSLDSGKIASLTHGMVETMQDLQESLKALQSGADKARSAGNVGLANRYSSTASDIQSKADRLANQTGMYNTGSGYAIDYHRANNPEFRDRMDNIQGARVRSSAAHLDKNSIDYIRGTATLQSDLATARNITGRAISRKGLNDNISSAQARGRMSYENYTSTLDRFDRRSQDIATARSEVGSQLVSKNSMVNDNLSSIKEYTNMQNAGQGDFSEEIANLELANRNIQKKIVSLEKFNKSLDEAEENLKIQLNILNDGTTDNSQLGSSDIKIDPKAGSFQANLKAMLPRAARSAVLQVQQGISTAYSQGNDLRTQMSPNVMGTVYGSLNTNNPVTDTDVIGQYNRMSVTNGAYYNSADLAGFSGAYQQATGDQNAGEYVRGGQSTGAIGVADYTSRFARFNNIQQGTATDLLTSAGNAGALSSASDAKNLENSIQSAINNSNMSAKADAQVQALNSLYTAMSGRDLTNGQARDIAGLQGEVAKYGPSMQGANFAQAYQGLGNFAGNFNSPLARMLAGGNSGKYAGIHGQAQLYIDMQNMRKSPQAMNKFVGNALRLNNGDSTVTQAMLSQEGNMTPQQAKAFIETYQKGGFTKKNLAEAEKAGNGTDKKQAAYEKSGQSGIDEANANATRNALAFSDALSGATKALARFQGALPGGMNVITNAAASATGGIIGAVGSQALLAGGKMVLGGAGLGGMAKAGLSTAGTIVGGTKLGGFIKGTSTFGKVAEGAGKVGEFASHTKGVIAGAAGILGLGGLMKAGSSLSGVAKGGEALGEASKVGSALGGAGKFLGGTGKMGGFLKGASVLGDVFTVGQGISDAKDAFTAPSGSVEKTKGTGGAIGTVLGGLAGGALGSIIPGAGTVVGAGIGAWGGQMLGEGIGSLFGSNKSKGKSNQTPNANSSESSLIAQNQKIIDNYNKMLTRADGILSRANKSNPLSMSSDNQSIGASQTSSNGKFAVNINVTIANKKESQAAMTKLGSDMANAFSTGLSQKNNFFSNSVSPT